MCSEAANEFTVPHQVKQGSFFILPTWVSCFPQVIGIAMDMFTDVDILHDILTAAMRNVAVYILLDEQNVHHFVNMLSNCRVNLQSFQVSTQNLKKKNEFSIYYYKITCHNFYTNTCNHCF